MAHEWEGKSLKLNTLGGVDIPIDSSAQLVSHQTAALGFPAPKCAGETSILQAADLTFVPPPPPRHIAAEPAPMDPPMKPFMDGMPKQTVWSAVEVVVVGVVKGGERGESGLAAAVAQAVVTA